MTISPKPNLAVPMKKSGGVFGSIIRDSGGSGSPVQVTIDGSGFGLEPNVVFYRDFDSYANGASIPLTAGVGEIGNFSQADMIIDTMNGYKAAQGFSGSVNKVLEIPLPSIQRFDLTHALTVPDGAYMPGSNDTGLETFSSDSGWKPFWLLNKSASNSNDSEADVCIPTHIGGGAFSISGNTVQSGTRFWNYNTEPHDHWDWNGLNVFNYVQDVGADPINDAVTQHRIFTSAKVGAATTKTVGTKAETASVAGFRAPAGNLLPENANYGLLKINAYALVSGTNPELTQAGYTWIYIAAESADGANDYRQKVFLGNAATLADCTLVKPKIADSWSDTEVVVSYTSAESEWATHAYVRKPDMTYTVVAL